MAEFAVSYCETVWAGSQSPFHIRLLEIDEPKVFGGGLTLPALCGSEVAWDIDMDVDAHKAVEASYTCVRCQQILVTMMRDADALASQG